MIYHFFNEIKYSIGLIKFFYEHRSDFCMQQKFFVVPYDQGLEGLKLNSNIKYLTIPDCVVSNSKEIFTEVLSNLSFEDIFVVHGFVNKRLMQFLGENRNILRQCVWSVWGGDLYYNGELGAKHTIREKKQYIMKVRQRNLIYPNIAVISSFAKECEYVKMLYGDHAFFAIDTKMSYPNPLEFDVLEKAKKKPLMQPKEITFMIGNSGTETNYHKDVFSILEKFQDKQFRAFVPLGYGSKSYIQEIVEIGKKKLGKKFIPIMDFLSPRKYAELLNSVDIAIFNHRRQQGASSMWALLFMGKKFYLRYDSPVFSWIHNLGIVAEDTRNLAQQTWDEIISTNAVQFEKNSQITREVYQEKTMVKYWRMIFERFEQERK